MSRYLAAAALLRIMLGLFTPKTFADYGKAVVRLLRIRPKMKLSPEVLTWTVFSISGLPHADSLMEHAPVLPFDDFMRDSRLSLLC